MLDGAGLGGLAESSDQTKNQRGAFIVTHPSPCSSPLFLLRAPPPTQPESPASKRRVKEDCMGLLARWVGLGRLPSSQ